MYDESVMPKSLDALVVSLCADYGRRRRMIERRNAPYPVIMECRFMNYRILEAAREVAGDRDAERFIRDIGSSVGYASSELYILSEKVYKNRKKQIKLAIAKKLRLF